MSTFDGVVKEFPDIRIDRFTNSSRRPALACFLSHIHSDHLQGLESFKSPFIYCSPATREMLLRLEKYPHRMNFARGILEQRKQTYGHLKKLLKPIPLETPTDIELAPGRSIRVTLFDANHCIGACMFLIEGYGKAILYTGDIRSEQWWVNGLCRHPILIPYISNYNKRPRKQLDAVYLDTSFAHKDDQYRHFPSKAEGIAELLDKLALYPGDTEFYFDTWTFGYEDVWLALSSSLRSQIHVDEYRYGMYLALHNGREPKAAEAYKLIGVHCGNHFQEGVLANRYRRIHSCERGTGCDVFDKDFVRITPIISRHNGVEMAEVGVGGGAGDLNQQHELEIDDDKVIKELMTMCVDKLQGQPKLFSEVVQILTEAMTSQRQVISLDLSGLAIETATHAAAKGDEDELEDMEDLPIERLVPLLTKMVSKMKQNVAVSAGQERRPSSGLPKQITFPYSRHSSYEELCWLLEAFEPRDIHPCTVDERNWSTLNSMSYLFGHLYERAPTFSHDTTMLLKQNAKATQHVLEDEASQLQETQVSQMSHNAEEIRHFKKEPPQQSYAPLSKRSRPTSSGLPKPKRSRGPGPRTIPPDIALQSTELDDRARSSNDKDARLSVYIKYWPPKGTQGKEQVSASMERELNWRRDQHVNHLDYADESNRSSRRIDGVAHLGDREERRPSSEEVTSSWQASSGRPGSSRSHEQVWTFEASSREHDTTTRVSIQSESHGRSSPPTGMLLEASTAFVKLTPGELKEALQREAYDAVLNDTGTWSLVSVDGHGTKEEEL